MAYDEALAARVRKALAQARGVREREAFGGISFMVQGKMVVGIHGEELMLRLGGAAEQRALAGGHARPFELGGKPMRGWLSIAAGGVRTQAQVARWTQQALEHAATLSAPKRKRTPGPVRRRSRAP